MRTRRGATGPPIVEDDSVNGGRPVSLYDLIYARSIGLAGLPMSLHAVPIDRDYSVDDPDPAVLILVNADELHAEAIARPGRPPTLSRFAMTAMKSDYWTGRSTIRELAVAHGVSKQTAWKIIHGLIGWYA